MFTYQINQLTLSLTSLFFSLLLLSSCGIPEAIESFDKQVGSITDQAVAVLDKAIGELGSANADWQQILEDVAKDLPAELQSTIAFELSRTLNRAIAASGSQVMCIVDFLHDRVREDLLRIKASLLGQPIAPLIPVLCEVESVAMANVRDNRQNNLLLFGYNFDINNPVQVVLLEGKQEVDVSQHLFVKTHYQMELNLGKGAVPLSADSKALIVRWQGQTLSNIPVIQPHLPTCKIKSFKFVPPNPIEFRPKKTKGDGDFDGHGPDVSILVKLHPQDLLRGAPRWTLEIYMQASETKSDWTTAKGTKFIENFIEVPEGYVVQRIITPLENEAAYRDEDMKDDTIYPTSFGPAAHFVVVGDTDGDEAGTKTKVKIFFNTIEFEIRQVKNCAKSS